MLLPLLILLQEREPEPWWFLIAMLVIGPLALMSGIYNVRTRTAEESGKSWLVGKALGMNTSHTGNKAIFMGVVRIIAGLGFTGYALYVILMRLF